MQGWIEVHPMAKNQKGPRLVQVSRINWIGHSEQGDKGCVEAGFIMAVHETYRQLQQLLQEAQVTWAGQ